MKFKIFSIITAIVMLSGCFEDKQLPPVEHTQFGYDILNLVEADAKLFKKLPANEIELTYYFSWGCPHCNAFNPFFLRWIANDSHAKQVTLKKTPVSLLPNWIDLSRLYYAAREKGFEKQLNVPIFKALHRKNKPLSEWIEDIAKFATPFAQKVDKNITTDNLIDLMESDDIAEQILSDNEKIMALKLHATPVLVVRYGDKFFKINVKNSKQTGGIINSLNRLINTLQKEKTK